jgi:hypothetical protein
LYPAYTLQAYRFHPSKAASIFSGILIQDRPQRAIGKELSRVALPKREVGNHIFTFYIGRVSGKYLI